MWKGKKVSVALPTYNEKESIRSCIEGLYNTGFIDEVVVCNNNAVVGTSQELARTAAREVFEKRQGYGWSCRKALLESTGDLVVLCEPDGSFEPADVIKLLAYSDDFDVVLGSRTNGELIWTGANMGWFMRWGNWTVAKYLEFLFNVTSLTDVGCTMRLMTRSVLERISPFFTVGGSYFGPEMTLLCVWSGARVIELPVNYKKRVGQSMVTASRWSAFVLGLRMILFITEFRLKAWLGRGPRIAGTETDSHQAVARRAHRHPES
ncbi:MAG: glycosyltransferase family 2 protein [Acidobacteria bacterium]|nr:glycosyltransferase family 2 protein [Acidobacteriota bacterium]